MTRDSSLRTFSLCSRWRSRSRSRWRGGWMLWRRWSRWPGWPRWRAWRRSSWWRGRRRWRTSSLEGSRLKCDWFTELLFESLQRLVWIISIRVIYILHQVLPHSASKIHRLLDRGPTLAEPCQPSTNVRHKCFSSVLRSGSSFSKSLILQNQSITCRRSIGFVSDFSRPIRS